MNDLLNTLFGLEGLGFGEEAVELGFARPIPAWGWFIALLVVAALAWWSYRRLDGSAVTRSGLAAMRVLVLLLILLLISGPQLVRPNDRVEQDWVIVLMDRSVSMTIADAPDDAAGGMPPPRSASGRISRDEQMKRAMNVGWPALSQMMDERTVLWLGFDSGVYDLGVREGPDGQRDGVDAGPAVGRRTAIGASLDQALQRVAARPVAGIVVFSDGRSVDEPTRQAMRRLQSERIPVITVPLGSSEPIADLAVMRADAPGMAFLEDDVPVTVEIERIGGEGPSRGRVELVDRATGRVLDERRLEERDEWHDGRTRVTLTSRPARAGKQTWSVRLIPDVPDLIEENNYGEVALEVVDRPVRIVYFDGYPRWEFRYLKNLLIRENSISSSSLLLASNRQYIQEGDVLLDALPRSPEDWAKFDVVVIGDIPATLFSREQLEQLREHIAVRGAGLLWVAGEGATPAAWRDSPLADLLPFAVGSTPMGSEARAVRRWEEPVVMVPTPAARRLHLLQLGDDPDEPWPAQLVDPQTGWSNLQWAQRIERAAVKPAAEILAEFVPRSLAGRDGLPAMDAAATSPAVLSMRYGAGRVLYVATDEIWRWRYARGETLPERFWLPLLRLQGRESLARSANPALLEVSPRRPEVDQDVRVAVHLVDQSLLDAAPAQATVRIRSMDDARALSAELALAPEQAEHGGAGPRAARSFASTWLPNEPGRYRIEPVDPLLSGLGLGIDVEVALPDDELRRPETDHALLTRLSNQTGGEVLPAERVQDLPGLLPNREVHIAGTPDVETLWDRPVFLVLLVLLLTVEWIGRRLMRLA
jgi:hypothetical protein